MSAVWADLTPPGGLDAWQMGEEQYWGNLGQWLKRSGVEDLVVDSEAAEERMVQIQSLVDNSVDDEDSCGLVLSIVDEHGGDNGVRLLERVLALGVDPDLPDKDGWRPSHEIIRHRRVRCLEVVFYCRPKLDAEGTYEDGEQQSVLDAFNELDSGEEMDDDTRDFYDKLDNIIDDGPPSVAELACNSHFWAVKNLFRRRLVSQEEALRRYNGRNVFQWAQHHGQAQLVNELYYLVSSPVVRDLRERTIGLENRMALVEHKVASTGAGDGHHARGCRAEVVEELKLHVRRQSSKVDTACVEVQELQAKARTQEEKLQRLQQEGRNAKTSTAAKFRNLQLLIDELSRKVRQLEMDVCFANDRAIAANEELRRIQETLINGGQQHSNDV